MCLPVQWNSEEEGSHGRRRRDSSHGAPLIIYGVYLFSGDVDCCAAFVSAQEVRGCERASRAKPRMREMFFSFSFPWEGQQKDPETTSTTHPGARLLLTKKMAGSLRTYYSTTTQEPYTCQTFQSWPTCILCIYSQLLMHAWKLSKICAFWVVAHKCAFTCLPPIQFSCEGETWHTMDISNVSRINYLNLHPYIYAPGYWKIEPKVNLKRFHFHVLNLFKSWSTLGFDQDS